MKFRFTKISITLVAVTMLAACASSPGSGMFPFAGYKKGSQPDPLYQPLKDVDFSKYQLVDKGLRLIARKGDYDILLTEPGYYYDLPWMGWNGLIDTSAKRIDNQFVGYMIRNRKRGSIPLPFIGHQIYMDDDGTVESYFGSYYQDSFKRDCMSCGLFYYSIFIDGFSKIKDSSGTIHQNPYSIRRFWEYYWSYHKRFTWKYEIDSENTTRKIKIKPTSQNQKAVFIEASGLPQYEFVLPHPDQVIAEFALVPKRTLFTREYSLVNLFKEKQINPDHLLLKPFGPTHLKRNFNKNNLRLHDHAWVDKGQSAFLYSPTTEKTYLVAYGDASPVVTLPSIKAIIQNGQRPVNQQCMGETEGVVVLSGQCDPRAPVFPLTVLTRASDNHYVINVWPDINHRSSYLLTGGQPPKKSFYRWDIDAFRVNKAVTPAATLAVLSTGNDLRVATSLKKIQNKIKQRKDKKVCAAATAAVSSAEKTLKNDPKIDEHINRYRKNLKENWDSNDPKIITRIDRGQSPAKTYRQDIGSHLSYTIREVNRRIKNLKPYQHINNSACQLNQKRMNKLLTALEDYRKSLQLTQNQLDRTYYADAKAYTKKLQDFNDQIQRIRDQQQAAAWNRMLANSQASLNSAISSLNATVSNIQRQNNTIMQNGLEARRLKAEQERHARFADIDTRRHAYFASDAPAVIEQKASPGASGKTPATGARKPNRLSTHDALAQAQQKTHRIKLAEEKREREKAERERQRLEQEKRAREKRAQEKAAREKIVHNVILTWQNKDGKWFACGPVQCTNGEGDDTEQRALDYVLGKPRHTIVGSSRYYRCYQYAITAKVKDTAGDQPEAKIRERANCRPGKVGSQ